MSTIVTRAGKGSALTHTEVDANFTNLNTDKVEKSGTDPVVISVNSSSDALRITQVGAGNALLVEDSTNPDATPFVVDATGNVGIGTTTPVQPLEVVGAGLASRTSKATNANSNARLYGGAYTGNLATFAVVSGSLTNNFITIGGGTSGGEPATAIAFNTGTVGATGTGTERMRIDSSGNVGIGTSSPLYQLQVGNATTTSTLGVIPDATNGTALRWGGTGAGAGVLRFVGLSDVERMRIDASGNLGLGVTPSASSLPTIEASVGLFVGRTEIDITSNAYFNSGWKYVGTGAATQYQANGGLHKWLNAPSGTAGNAITFTQAMTLDASGNLGIGTSSPGTKLVVTGAGNITSTISSSSGFAQLSLSGSSGQNAYVTYTTTGGGALGFFDATAGSERARIDSSGDLLVGATSNFSSAVRGYFVAPSGGIAGGFSNPSTGAVNQVLFINPNGAVGSIQTNGSLTSYNVSSDYRLKNTIAPMTGALAKVALLKPCTYKWNVDGSDGEGFIAHELQEVVPDCVTGEKDAVDADGNPVYQGIDTSFLVATLTAAIQELKAELDATKAEVAALKGA